MMSGPNSLPQRKDLQEEQVGEELVLYHHASRKSVYLNESGAVVWKLCDGQRTVQQIIDLLAESYPDAKADMAADVWESINNLRREGVLQLNDAEPSEPG